MLCVHACQCSDCSLSPTVTDASPRKRTVSFRSRQRKATVTEKPKKKIKLSAKLSKCVNYVQSVHFPGIDGYDGGGCGYVCTCDGCGYGTECVCVHVSVGLVYMYVYMHIYM